MREIKIERNDSGQRLDKFLQKYLKEASRGFLFKMLRKKNITLNGKKAEGSEILSEGDTVSVFSRMRRLKSFAVYKKGIGIQRQNSISYMKIVKSHFLTSQSGCYRKRREKAMLLL